MIVFVFNVVVVVVVVVVVLGSLRKISRQVFKTILYTSAMKTTTAEMYGTALSFAGRVLEYRMTRTRVVCWMTTPKKLRYFALMIISTKRKH